MCCRCSLFVVHPEEACKKEYLLDPYEMTVVYMVMLSSAIETLSLVVDICLNGCVSSGHCGRYQNSDGLIYRVQGFLLWQNALDPYKYNNDEHFALTTAAKYLILK